MKETQNVLVVDDEPEVCNLVARCLQPGGYEVETAYCGAEMQQRISDKLYDLIVLDLNLQGEDGLMYLRNLRQEMDIPVIILTARGEPVDRIVGLELGADDYLPKPFEPRELLARVRTVLRRVKPESENVTLSNKRQLHFAGWILDLHTRQLKTEAGQPVELTTAQYDVLVTLATHPNRVLTRDQILDFARDREGTPFDRSIDVHIGHLRQKIEHDRRHPEIIKTVHGAGYMFAAKVATQ
ncbi:response regulator [Sedimenticola hydrogenitrophicus]|uniref:response regulator n=1 Tax=Sedimenticola hydrogenitrophicus TaxID=2967975 RepID=UPI0023B1A1E0|nr:response regulator [Sedimenticola hydrogenitrophicus]